MGLFSPSRSPRDLKIDAILERIAWQLPRDFCAREMERRLVAAIKTIPQRPPLGGFKTEMPPCCGCCATKAQ